ncbi:MAG TPA: OsmC family protein [Candidatus Methylomirabilis sp.]|nr:OsmC family protein [Candidatus Methylomirabilis sp.]
MDLISVHLEHDLAFQATVRGHRILMDMRGHPRFADGGPSPVELMVMAIGGCIGMHVALFCEQMNLSPAGLRVDLSFALADQNGRKRVSSVYAEVDAPGIPTDLLPAAERAARLSILPNSFIKTPELDIEVRNGPGQ